MDSNEKCAIAQVVRLEESSYRREGARMLVFESGVFEGGISGGCLEGDALKRSQMAILQQKPSIVTYDTSKEHEIGVGLGCNGVIDVLITPITAHSRLMSILRSCVAERRENVIATVTALEGEWEGVTLGSSFYFEEGNLVFQETTDALYLDFVNEKIGEVRQTKKSKTYHYQSGSKKASLFVELIPPQFHLAIYGDNYDVYPLLEVAAVLDWEVSLVGNVQKLQKEKLRTVKEIYPKDMADRPKIDARTAIVLMAHDYRTDYANLRQVICSPAPYIATLGPRKRFEAMMADFHAVGITFSEEQLKRVYAPCGLAIGAITPEEIAVSIISEILGVFSNGSGGLLRDRIGPIHTR